MTDQPTMTKGERRKARQQARAEGRPLVGDLAVSTDRQADRDTGPHSFSETQRGYRARQRWAERYDRLNGAPESEYDR